MFQWQDRSIGLGCTRLVGSCNHRSGHERIMAALIVSLCCTETINNFCCETASSSTSCCNTNTHWCAGSVNKFLLQGIPESQDPLPVLICSVHIRQAPTVSIAVPCVTAIGRVEPLMGEPAAQYCTSYSKAVCHIRRQKPKLSHNLMCSQSCCSHPRRHCQSNEKGCLHDNGTM